MSGDDLRRCCIHNHVDELKEYLTLRANPCSADQFGLTALHYAVWNGHLECVRYIMMNPYGVTKDRQKKSCVNLKSCMGYTALHLVALECPLKALKDILFALLIAGADIREVDQDGKTPMQVAKETKNQLFVDSLQEFVHIQRTSKETLKKMFADMKKKYTLFKPKRLAKGSTSDGEGTDGEVEDQTDVILSPEGFPIVKKKADPFKDIPDALRQMIETCEKPITIDKPSSLNVHEQLIPSMTRFSFVAMNGLDSLKGLSFIKEEALKNVSRREKLVQQFDQTLPKIDIKKIT
jgi:hypothetical protein